MFASLAGCNESERIGGPESEKPRKPSCQPDGEGSMNNRNLTETIDSFRRGGSDGMQTIERGEQQGIQSMPTQKVYITSTRLYTGQIALAISGLA